ncbi:MAG: hypothetical protein C4526_04110 [Nitrospiraceae bacterium]|nr:MAG: hypothetical protein C4526_04110 [Nitrospiraceae bacterium]
MSFILEALKKLEQKKKRGSVPDIMTVHMPEPHKPLKRPVWFYLVLAALVLNAGILASLLRPPIPVVEKQNKQEMKESATPPIPPLVRVGEEVVAPAKTAVKPDSSKKQNRQAKTQGRAANRKEVMQHDNNKKEQQDVPELSRLPQTVQGEISPLKVFGHVYSDSPATRMVNINGNVFREGDKINEKIMIDEITENSVVFNYNGLRFIIRVF